MTILTDGEILEAIEEEGITDEATKTVLLRIIRQEARKNGR